MSVQYWVAFGLLSAWILGFAIGVVALRNIVHAAISMVACFLGVAGIFALLHSGLLAVIQILLYVGAISVVILFAVMLTEQLKGGYGTFFNRQSVFAAPFVVAAAALFTVVLVTSKIPFTDSTAHNVLSVRTVSQGLFRGYVFPFELVSVVLLAAMIGVIMLARRED